MKYVIKNSFGYYKFYRKIPNLSKEEIMIRFEEINTILENYKEEALKEYTELETKRHAHFTYENRDGSSSESSLRIHWSYIIVLLIHRLLARITVLRSLFLMRF